MNEKSSDMISEYLEVWEREFKGWDFSYLEKYGRMREFPLSWNYYNEIRKYLKDSQSLLDMGTGGGEFLSELIPLPKKTCATEGYRPNLEIAKKRLEPLGVKVYEIKEDDNMPFDDEEFDLIINRHESYSEKEVRRILKKGGYFITQQVGGCNDKELNMYLNAEPFEYREWDLDKAVKNLEKNNFKIIKRKEDKTKTRFYDICAVIYYLKAISWQISDFSIDKYYIKLRELDFKIEEMDYIDVTCHRFIIIACKN
ncbi:class I SAM-dependent methyltransferase [Caminicella sporogenes]|uniref:class I SAM-dependent methyltransferase n=1 Tax=Caminicella sporogenes TaxID=166485 RepID=UPI00253FC194|nr:class I SAM-dependent methyltransferase [Caminicella sporogenes]WIF94189.1 class I SAM-dependent methyltransferase [Caminicella sporogenes]